ncbi:hypothetical protein PM082_015649 [Marasmius tenuissimus]|nr:hypothetical protein PM082_015649 [Marasmius tenuissimus]
MPQRLSTEQLEAIIHALHDFSAAPADFIISLATNSQLIQDKAELEERLEDILDAFKESTGLRDTTINWSRKQLMHDQACYLRASGSCGHRQNEAVDIDKIAAEMREMAPDLWDLLGVLLNASPDLQGLREKRDKEKGRRKGEKEAEDLDEDQYWDAHSAADILSDPVEDVEDGDEDEEKHRNAMERRNTLLVVRQVVCISTMMQSTNQRCNAIQSLIGLFLHACNAPETVTELLAHIRVSISASAIKDAVKSLSEESRKQIRAATRELLSAYAFDNIDIDLPHAPTLENPLATLLHLTSGTIIPFQHGVTKEDLNCSDEIWQKSSLNRHRTSTHSIIVLPIAWLGSPAEP